MSVIIQELHEDELGFCVFSRLRPQMIYLATLKRETARSPLGDFFPPLLFFKRLPSNIPKWRRAKRLSHQTPLSHPRFYPATFGGRVGFSQNPTRLRKQNSRSAPVSTWWDAANTTLRTVVLLHKHPQHRLQPRTPAEKQKQTHGERPKRKAAAILKETN